MTALGDFITQARTAKKLSLSETARRAGITKSYLHSIEHGQTADPSARNLIKIAKALEIEDYWDLLQAVSEDAK